MGVLFVSFGGGYILHLGSGSRKILNRMVFRTLMTVNVEVKQLKQFSLRLLCVIAYRVIS